MGETGEIIAGPGSNTIFRDAAQVAQQYGGQATDWVKKVSSDYVLNGVRQQTHWVENLVTGAQVLQKTVMEFVK